MILLVLFVLVAGSYAREFNVTHFFVPSVVPPEQQDVELECRYEGNFTLLNWFKGRYEFFRYKPGAAPSTRSFPILGVGRVELVMCGPTMCRLRLGGLTEEASGMYRCDIERDIPPYKYATKNATMHVAGLEHRKPLLEGLAEEYGDGDLIQAYCRAESQTELRWYINGKEINESRGSRNLKYTSSRFIFTGIPPTITVQCAEMINGKLIGSEGVKAQWHETFSMLQGHQLAQERINRADNEKIFKALIVLSIFTNILPYNNLSG